MPCTNVAKKKELTSRKQIAGQKSKKRKKSPIHPRNSMSSHPPVRRRMPQGGARLYSSEQGKSETLRLDLRIMSNDIFCANCRTKLGCPSNYPCSLKRITFHTAFQKIHIFWLVKALFLYPLKVYLNIVLRPQRFYKGVS